MERLARIDPKLVNKLDSANSPKDIDRTASELVRSVAEETFEVLPLLKVLEVGYADTRVKGNLQIRRGEAIIRHVENYFTRDGFMAKRLLPARPIGVEEEDYESNEEVLDSIDKSLTRLERFGVGPASERKGVGDIPNIRSFLIGVDQTISNAGFLDEGKMVFVTSGSGVNEGNSVTAANSLARVRAVFESSRQSNGTTKINYIDELQDSLATLSSSIVGEDIYTRKINGVSLDELYKEESFEDFKTKSMLLLSSLPKGNLIWQRIASSLFFTVHGAPREGFATEEVYKNAAFARNVSKFQMWLASQLLLPSLDEYSTDFSFNGKFRNIIGNADRDTLVSIGRLPINVLANAPYIQRTAGEDSFHLLDLVTQREEYVSPLPTHAQRQLKHFLLSHRYIFTDLSERFGTSRNYSTFMKVFKNSLITESSSAGGDGFIKLLQLKGHLDQWSKPVEATRSHSLLERLLEENVGKVRTAFVSNPEVVSIGFNSLSYSVNQKGQVEFELLGKSGYVNGHLTTEGLKFMSVSFRQENRAVEEHLENAIIQEFLAVSPDVNIQEIQDSIESSNTSTDPIPEAIPTPKEAMAFFQQFVKFTYGK